MITGRDCENAIEAHRRLNGCNSEHILREAFGRLLAEREAYREVAIKAYSCVVPVVSKAGPTSANLVDFEAQCLMEKKEGEK